jgi:hypothetical protein
MHLAFPFPFWEEVARYVYFDTEVPASERERFMAFYRGSLQRTLYIYGPTKHLLSKTPAHSGRIGTLREAFPDAKFIYTARDPAAVVPSTMSLFSFYWGAFSDLLDAYPFREWVLEFTKHWYRYPIQRLQQSPANSYAVVKYDDLVRDLEQTITDAYAALGLDLNPEYAQRLQEEAQEARRYRSKHRYSLRDAGFSQQQIAAEYQHVFDRFGFETD